jgi:Tol biopolymer transport system component
VRLPATGLCVPVPAWTLAVMTKYSAVPRTSRIAWLAGLSVLAALVAVPAPAAADGVSVAGGRIAFVSNRDGNPEIYTMNADGSAPTRLTDHPEVDAHPAWSPDGTRIAFTRYAQITLPDGTVDRDADIHVMNADGTGLTNLSRSPGTFELDPTWSPDGSRLAFVRAGDQLPRIWTMNADGSGLVALTTTGGAIGDWHPSWSPDGRRVLFDRIGCASSDPGGIYAVTTDGSATVSTVRTAEQEILFQPSTAPDQARIAYQSISTTNRATLIECLVLLALLAIDLTSDGLTIALGPAEVVVANADGTAPASFPSGELQALASALTWAPDGRRLAFASGQQETFADADIHVLDTATGTTSNITNSPDASDHSPDWQFRTCTIVGTQHGDVLQGTGGTDVICAFGGNDVILGGSGNDVIHGGPGTDVIYGQDGNDTAVGGPGFDFVYGGNGNDAIDTVDGTGGNDVADGGLGTDTCTVDAGPPADFRISC